MNKNQTTWLAMSLLLAGQAACTVGTAHAGDFDVRDTTSTKDFGKDMGNTISEGNFGRQKFAITLDTRFGYDDNTLGTPDHVTEVVTDRTTGLPVVNSRGQYVTREASVDNSDSAFFNFDLGVSYTAANPRASLTIGADVGVSYYFDRPGRDYDVNGGASGRFTYKLTPRAFLDLSTYNAYESAGDYGASNISGFTGQFGTNGRIPGTTADRTSDYFYTTDRGALTYQFAPRLSAVFSTNLVAFAYDDTPYSTDQDRIEVYPAVDLQYLLEPNLSLAVSYRFGYIDYFGVNNDSYTHFILGGVDYSFSQRLHATFRAGAEFRRYFDTVGDENSPYAEGAITYDISKNSHLSLNGRYGIEEGVLSEANSKADTVRVGVDFEQNFTARISGYVSFYYTHAQYETLNTVVAADTATTVNGGSSAAVLNTSSNLPNFSEDTYDVAVGARYAINRHLAAEIGYTHTTFNSELRDREYDRNRYFGGLRVQF